MVFRIHFTVEDLARTRVAEAPWPLLETSFAVRWLQARSQPSGGDAWRRRAISCLPPQARMVFDLTPATGYTPCFIGTDQPGSPNEQLELVRRTPQAKIRADLQHFALQRKIPSWARRLDDDPSMLQRLADSLGEVYAVLVAPYWSRLGARFTADRTVRARDLLDGGIQRLLAGLHPTRIRWNPPVLEVRTVTPYDADLHLGGRGLLLIPTVFGSVAPTIAPDARPQPYLTYPARVDGRPWLTDPGDPAGAELAAVTVALLGRTRAAILHAVAEHPGCSTSELATAVGVSQSSASEHATVLRANGLITTSRHRQTALHAPTPTGIALLTAAGPAGNTTQDHEPVRFHLI